VIPFNGSNGNQPWTSLTGSHGTTLYGGKYSVGNVFELTFGRNSRSTYVFNPTNLWILPSGNPACR
jgi:hypothetical protein